MLFYSGLFLLAALGIGIDTTREVLLNANSLSFTLTIPILIFDVVAGILFMGLVIWLAQKLKSFSFPKLAALGVILIGLTLVCANLLYGSGINIPFFAKFQIHRTLAGAFLLIVGFTQLFPRTPVKVYLPN